MYLFIVKLTLLLTIIVEKSFSQLVLSVDDKDDNGAFEDNFYTNGTIYILIVSGIASLDTMIPLIGMETACRHHPPPWKIKIAIMEPSDAIIEYNLHQAFEDNLKNGNYPCDLSFMEFDLLNEIKDTPLVDYFEENNYENYKIFKNGIYWNDYVHDLFRYIVHWKYGGWVITSDTIVLRPLEKMNIVGLEKRIFQSPPVIQYDGSLVIGQKANVNAAISHFTSKHPFLHLYHLVFKERVDIRDVKSLRVEILTKALSIYGHQNCRDVYCVTIIESNVFYPISDTILEKSRLFSPVSLVEYGRVTNGSYTLHLWQGGQEKTGEDETGQQRYQNQQPKCYSDSMIDRAYRSNCIFCSNICNNK